MKLHDPVWLPRNGGKKLSLPLPAFLVCSPKKLKRLCQLVCVVGFLSPTCWNPNSYYWFMCLLCIFFSNDVEGKRTSNTCLIESKKTLLWINTYRLFEFQPFPFLRILCISCIFSATRGHNFDSFCPNDRNIKLLRTRNCHFVQNFTSSIS